jgi:hypothetical protein
MASEVRVNTINNRTGIGTIALSDTGVTVTGFTTFTTTDLEVTDGFYTNDQTLNANKTLRSDRNAGVFGPYTIASGTTLTIQSGATFTVL